MNEDNLSSQVRIGIDTGGTFTDYVIVTNGHISAWKTPTTPTDPSEGIIFGFSEIMDKHHFQKNDVEVIVHGTTIGTNAFLEDKCPPIAFLTTKGFKDIVEIGRQQRSELYNLKFNQKYPVNFQKDVLYEVEERVDSNGKIVKSLDLRSLENSLQMFESKSVKNLAISFLFSFLNIEHEKRVAEYFSEKGYNVFTSHEISPQIKEYERAVTTIVNAKVSPVVNSYLSRLKSKLINLGVESPLLIMQSNTGMADVVSIGKSGIQTLYSGLAGGVLAAADSLKHLNRTHLVSLDIGGTSTDVAALINGPIVLRSREFRGFPLVASMVDVETIGSGGGSIADFKDGLLSVGPESQGANPGPACYSLGGDKVTLTDANLYLGYVHQDNFAGSLNIDKDKATLQLNNLLNEIKSSPFPLEIVTVDELALSIRKILNNNIANAIRVVTIQRGLDPRDFALLGFGGAGPLQAWEIAQELEMDGVIIPPFPGVWSAFGLVCSDIKHEHTQSYLQTKDEVDFTEMNEKLKEIEENLKEVLTSEEVGSKNQSFDYSLDMRYIGQSDFLALPVTFPIDRNQLESVAEKFHLLHDQNYSWFDKELIVEIVNLSVRGVGKVPRIEFTKLAKGSENPPEDAIKTNRRVNFDGEWIDIPVYDKQKLLSGNVLGGPCIIDQLDTTTVIPPSVIGRVNSLGYIIMEERK
ncbi:MAG: hydantoinase/oxoprolinase family protein [Candidatus Heimdallarchaeota archaeon]|nr:hydantoinase/oxoprolinase family protein [Candidatus Heimdallarchaeota archaeon]MCK5142651.1 hydantoinase/oxoprolinase family protein [Candidatus Heimdallarchaeota archaeon]